MVVIMRLRQRRAHAVIAELDESAWQLMSCGDGVHGLASTTVRVVPIRPSREPSRGHWLLVRRPITDPGAGRLLHLLRARRHPARRTRSSREFVQYRLGQPEFGGEAK